MRTLISYKETHFNSPVDPQDPPTWTGTWADPRFSPPADGGRASNALTGQTTLVLDGTADITVPYQYAKLRLWRNTAAATLSPGQSLTLDPGGGTLGFEWDVDPDNGFRPPGLFELSSTTVTGADSFTDYGSTDPNYTQTHHLTLYRAPSGALVFGAGTIQWSWGLDNTNAWGAARTDPSGNPPDPNMEQATVNLLADMGAMPATLISGLVAGNSHRRIARHPHRRSARRPAARRCLDGSRATITGNAQATPAERRLRSRNLDRRRQQPGIQRRSRRADSQSVSWSYSWIAHGYPSTTIETRAVDDSGNLETPSDAITANITCPCSLWGTNIIPSGPFAGLVDSGDPNAITVGVQFTGAIDSQVTGIRFYKAPRTPERTSAALWTSSGTLLAQATFANETASGWQSVNFSNPSSSRPARRTSPATSRRTAIISTDGGWFYPAPAPTRPAAPPTSVARGKR